MSALMSAPAASGCAALASESGGEGEGRVKEPRRAGGSSARTRGIVAAVPGAAVPLANVPSPPGAGWGLVRLGFPLAGERLAHLGHAVRPGLRSLRARAVDHGIGW